MTARGAFCSGMDAGRCKGTIREMLRLIGREAVSHEGIYHQALDHDGRGKTFRFTERVAERYDLHGQGYAEVREHGDSKKTAELVIC